MRQIMTRIQAPNKIELPKTCCVGKFLQATNIGGGCKNVLLKKNKIENNIVSERCMTNKIKKKG